MNVLNTSESLSAHLDADHLFLVCLLSLYLRTIEFTDKQRTEETTRNSIPCSFTGSLTVHPPLNQIPLNITEPWEGHLLRFYLQFDGSI